MTVTLADKDYFIGPEHQVFFGTYQGTGTNFSYNSDRDIKSICTFSEGGKKPIIADFLTLININESKFNELKQLKMIFGAMDLFALKFQNLLPARDGLRLKMESSQPRSPAESRT